MKRYFFRLCVALLIAACSLQPANSQGVSAGWRLVAKRKVPQHVSRYQLPSHISAFTVLGLLKDIEQNNGFSDDRKQELRSSIHRLERYYFSEPNGEEPNLCQIAETWVHSAS